MTKAEVRLWFRLKQIRSEGIHFRRQAPFRGYYLDFVCFSRRLVIELNGWRHAEDEGLAHDMVRGAVLAGKDSKCCGFGITSSMTL
jgi:very-short-patch-repair endonuclease